MPNLRLKERYNMTNFSDIFKSSFLENITSVSMVDMVIVLSLVFGIGLFIFLVYKKTYSGVMYSSGFGGTLVALTMITSMTILAVTSNVVLRVCKKIVIWLRNLANS